MPRVLFVVLYVASSLAIWLMHIVGTLGAVGYGAPAFLAMSNPWEFLDSWPLSMLVLGPVVLLLAALWRGVTVKRPYLVGFPILDLAVLYGVEYWFLLPHSHPHDLRLDKVALGPAILCVFILDPICCVLGWRKGAEEAQ
jgi:hypothetical protein